MKKAIPGALAALLAAAVALPLAAAPSATAVPARQGDSRSHGHDGRHQHRPAVPFTRAQVTAAPTENGTFTLTWSAEGVRRVTIEAAGRVVARGGATGTAVVTGLPAADRRWFTFRADRGEPLRLADRLVRLEGTANLRDAGGYRTADGRWVRMGEVYRSDALDKLTDADRATLRRLGIATVFDLRMRDEREKAPDRVPAGAEYVVADVFAGSGSFQVLPRTPEEAVAAMVTAERAMVGGEGGRKAYTRVFEGIRRTADPRDGRAVLFHCTAGKDRTGWAGAALLTALGVPADTVMADYLASNDYRKAANEAVLGHLPPQQAAVYKPLLDVRPEYLDAGHDELATRFGSFPAYLKALSVDGHDLRHLQRDLLTD
ncbi:tyrosine-protein phosphatase [Streptomyces sp. NPDC097619]|uniref:tyrosine-protein phosphatase n=1 Tax=Streptomyces sp. NPDC097619 TaxID=3157228 RepID=UPI00331808FD